MKDLLVLTTQRQ
jgi:hypothetical protein